MFKNRIFTISVATSFFVAMGMFGAIMYIPLFMQAVIGDSAQHSGIMLTPMMLGFMVSRIVGGQLMSRTGKYKMITIVSLAISIVGVYLLSLMNADATNGLVVRYMVVAGFGMGALMSLFTIVVQNAFPFRQMGVVTANLQFFRSIGSTVGIAVFGSLLTSQFTHELPKKIPHAVTRLLPHGALSSISNPSVLLSPAASHQLDRVFAKLGPRGVVLARLLIHGVRAALSSGTQLVFLIGAGLLGIAFILALGLPEIALRKHNDDPPMTAVEPVDSHTVLGVALARAIQ